MADIQTTNIVYGSLTPREQATIITPEDKWTDDFALKVVVQDFSYAENYRTVNHDWRWQNADRLYLGYVAQKYWEGTKIPRANIPVFVAYEQVESLVPRVMQAIFSDNPWFEANAVGRTKASAARKSRDIILTQTSECHIEDVIDRGVRTGCIYGNGVWEACWYYNKQTVKKFLPRFVPERRLVRHPVTGQIFPAPTGQFKRVVVEIEDEEYENRPELECVPLKDFYIDPNCPTPNPEDARYTIRRRYIDADEVRGYAEYDGFNVPGDAVLIAMTQQKPSAQADNTKNWQESARMGLWNSQVDQTLDPAGGRIELLCYKTNRRIVWVLNRTHVLYNVPNPYGKKLQYNFCYTDIIDRFYGLALSDVVEGEQLLQEGILNGRIDELALNIHASTVVKRGNSEPVYKLRVRPGGVNYSDDPSKDFVRQYTGNVTQQAFAETAASDQRVQKLTGINDLVSGGQNPVARSATGAGLQGQAIYSRVQYLVHKAELKVLEPMLNDFHMLNQHHLDPDQAIEAVTETDGQILDPMEVFGAKVKFEMRAATRMASRNALATQMPYLIQYMANPQLIEQLTRQGKTVDMIEIMQMFLDSTGYRKKAEWIRDLTPQEKAALQAAAQNPQSADLQKQRERMSSMENMKLTDNEMKLIGKAIDGRIAMLLADKAIKADKVKDSSDD